MNCDCCDWITVNGTFCHEAGCPNERKEWNGEKWVRMVTCWWCDFEVEEGEVCVCQWAEDEDEDHSVLDEEEAQ